MKFLYSLIFILLFTSCGYQPSAKQSRSVIGDKVSTEVIISIVDPENTVIIKDALDLAVIQVFHASLVDKKESTSHLTIELINPIYLPIQYDRDGFIISYRITTKIRVKRTTKDIEKYYSAFGTFDFSVAPNSIITDQQRFEGIKQSAIKAIRSFLAQVAAEGARKNKS